MKKIILDKYQVHDLISKNLYPVEEKNKLLSRCIDGRYPNLKNLPALAIPGADIGQLAVIISTANVYGFEIDLEKTYRSFIEVVGGEGNFRFHTDCGYYNQIKLDPKAYSLENNQLSFIKQKLALLKKQGVEELSLSGEHSEGAVIQMTGGCGLYPRFIVDGMEASAFIYHKDLINRRHIIIAQKLINTKAIKFFADFDASYLYEALSEVADDHFFATLKRLATGLPMYHAKVNNKNDIIVEEMGQV